MAVVIRHGRWDYRDDRLLPEGREEAIARAEEFAGFRRVICSPKGRSQETAQALGYAQFAVDPRVEEFFPEDDVEFAALVSTGVLQLKAVFQIERLRNVLEERSYILLSRIRSLGDDVLIVSHKITMCGLKLALSGKRNWVSEDFEGNTFHNLESLEIPNVN